MFHLFHLAPLVDPFHLAPPVSTIWCRAPPSLPPLLSSFRTDDDLRRSPMQRH
jgi:hypothetical protein